MYLIEFSYEYYCQGFEWTTTMVLVRAASFNEACDKILENYHTYANAKDFINKTIA